MALATDLYGLAARALILWHTRMPTFRFGGRDIRVARIFES